MHGRHTRVARHLSLRGSFFVRVLGRSVQVRKVKGVRGEQVGEWVGVGRGRVEGIGVAGEKIPAALHLVVVRVEGVAF